MRNNYGQFISPLPVCLVPSVCGQIFVWYQEVHPACRIATSVVCMGLDWRFVAKSEFDFCNHIVNCCVAVVCGSTRRQWLCHILHPPVTPCMNGSSSLGTCCCLYNHYHPAEVLGNTQRHSDAAVIAMCSHLAHYIKILHSLQNRTVWLMDICYCFLSCVSHNKAYFMPRERPMIFMW